MHKPLAKMCTNRIPTFGHKDKIPKRFQILDCHKTVEHQSTIFIFNYNNATTIHHIFITNSNDDISTIRLQMFERHAFASPYLALPWCAARTAFL